jgi:Lon protease-like protein
MSPSPTNIGVFPLPICLLPQGITRLRIFEPRYKRLVSEAAQGKGFALSSFDETMPFQSSIDATLVDIVDFSQLPDGLVAIDIKANNLITLTDFKEEHDGLRRANFSIQDHWSTHPGLTPTLHASQIRIITQTLIHIITHDEGLTAFYPQPHYDDLTWVCARFIELLPLSYKKKQSLIYQQSFEQVQDFLHTVVTGEH